MFFVHAQTENVSKNYIILNLRRAKRKQLLEIANFLFFHFENWKFHGTLDFRNSWISGIPEFVPEMQSSMKYRYQISIFEMKSRIRFPEIRIPEIRIPEIRIPEIRIPEIRIPEIRIPEIRIPEIRIPEIRILEIRIPEIRIPETRIPEIG